VLRIRVKIWATKLGDSVGLKAATFMAAFFFLLLSGWVRIWNDDHFGEPFFKTSELIV
jgi:hypothetical protein